MGLNIAVDFDQNDWVALYASNTDPANLIGAVSVKASDIRRQPTGTGGSAAAGTAFGRYVQDRATFGKDRINWTTGTTTNCFINIGYNGVFEAGLMSLAAGTYTISVYAKLATGSSTDTFSLVLTNAVSANYAVSAAAALNSTTWTRFTVSGVTPSIQNLCLQFYRITGSTSKVVEITAPMLVSGSSVLTFNCGAASLLEPITAFSEEAGWELGFKSPYQYVPPTSRATFKLNNDSKRFSPEYGSGPLFGDLVPGLLVQIGDPAYGIKWTGWTESWSPTPGLYGPRDCTLTATDAKTFLDAPFNFLPLQVGIGDGTLVSNYLLASLVRLPNTSEGIPAATGSEPVNWDSLSGETVPYYGDGNNEKDPAIKVIADVVGGVQGKFWFNRSGQYSFYTSQGDDTPASYVNIGAQWMTAVYGDAPIINDSNASVFRRKASGGVVTLWELDETITLTSGQVEKIRIYFRNTTTDKIVVGALPLSIAITHTASGASTLSYTLAPAAQSVDVYFENLAGVSRNILTATLTGTRIVALREILKNYTDATSKNTYGIKTEKLTFNWVQSRTWAAKLAKYRVERFKTPRKVMTQIKLNSIAMPSEVQQLNIGRAVYVSDDQTAHAGYYAVIGESHSAKAGLSDQMATFYLEPLYPTTVAATSV